MTTNTAPTIRRFTRWDLDTLRAGKAYRDEHGPAIPELDVMLAAAERQFAELSFDREVEPAAAAEAPRRTGSGYGSTGGTRNAATPAQLGFLAKLYRSLGEEIPTPRDKRHASDLIENAKRRVAKLPAASRPARMATERQQEFLASLLTERAHDHGELDPATVTADRASQLISELMASPRAKVAAHGIREGRYAYSVDGGATADHYRVTRGGKIVVWTAGGEFPYTGKGLNEALTWIRDNQRAAAELFGQLVGSCGRCGRDLSDDDSRALGLGPVCASKEW